jgi:cytochrome oxidase Cu insertion factor (SCO1/SenC/PrrC family)
MRLVARFFLLVLVCSALVAPAVAQNRTSPVGVGEVAPDFTLESHRGTKVTLSEAREKSPVVLVFYRGYW